MTAEAEWARCGQVELRLAEQGAVRVVDFSVGE